MLKAKLLPSHLTQIQYYNHRTEVMSKVENIVNCPNGLFLPSEIWQ